MRFAAPVDTGDASASAAASFEEQWAVGQRDEGDGGHHGDDGARSGGREGHGDGGREDVEEPVVVGPAGRHPAAPFERGQEAGLEGHFAVFHQQNSERVPVQMETVEVRESQVQPDRNRRRLGLPGEGRGKRWCPGSCRFDGCGSGPGSGASQLQFPLGNRNPTALGR